MVRHKTEKLNILLINSAILGDAYGGSYRFTFDLAKALTNAGHNVFLFGGNSTGAIPETAKEYAGRVVIYRRTVGGLIARLYQFRNIVESLGQLLSRVSFDVIWGHSPIETFAYFLISKRFSSPLFVYTVHSPWLLEISSNKIGRASLVERSIAKRVDATIIKRADQVHFLSQAMRDLTELTYGFKLPEAKVSIIPGGIWDTGHHLNLAARHTLSKTETHFLTLRRLVPRMGLDRLLAAAQILSTKRRDFHCTIGGQGPLRAELERKIKERDLAKYISLTGFIPEGALEQYYSDADCMIVPTTELEGFGLVILEAWIRGIPVIGTPIGGMKELLLRHTPECLTKSAQAVDIAEKMLWFMDLTHAQRAELSEKVKEAAREYYWGNLVEDYLELVRENLAMKTKGLAPTRRGSRSSISSG